MTFDDDFVQLRLSTGPMNVALKALGLSWPPPEFIAIAGGPYSAPTFRRIRHSSITDEERAGMTHVCRGAEYVHCDPSEIDDLTDAQVQGADSMAAPLP